MGISNARALSIIKSRNAGVLYHEAMKLAELALERQIPTSPYNLIYCPVCDFPIGDLDGNHFNFCPMCGQRLDFPKKNN